MAAEEPVNGESFNNAEIALGDNYSPFKGEVGRGSGIIIP